MRLSYLHVGPHFVTLRSMNAAIIDPCTRIVFVLVCLVVTDEMSDFAAALPYTSDLEELGRALARGQAMVAADPDLAERAKAMRLVAALRADPAVNASTTAEGDAPATS